MIFQEPMLALDPVYTIGDQIAETVMRHEGVSTREARAARAGDARAACAFRPPGGGSTSYPHEMSGGMRQRAMIALALACRPKVLLADEPTTALDATVQIQILLLLRELQREFGMSVIFVTHDIGVAVEICDRVAVMYAGRIVEQGTLREVVRTPVHPLCARPAAPRPSMAPNAASGWRPFPARRRRSTRRRTIAPSRRAARCARTPLHRGAAAQCDAGAGPPGALHPGGTNRAVAAT